MFSLEVRLYMYHVFLNSKYYYTVEFVLKDHPINTKNVVSQVLQIINTLVLIMDDEMKLITEDYLNLVATSYHQLHIVILGQQVSAE